MKKMMKKVLLAMIFCIFCFKGSKEAVWADSIWFPEDEFVKEHEGECVKLMNHYGGRKYVTLVSNIPICDSPEGWSYDNVIRKGDIYNIYYLYTDPEDGRLWGCTAESTWLPMKNMQLIYDGVEFNKEHQSKIGTYTGAIQGYEAVFPLRLYDYPGSKTVIEKMEADDLDQEISLEGWMMPAYFYQDEEGRLWGYMDSYNMGYHKGWYCISDLPRSIIRDYNQNGSLDLSDATILLRAALKLDNMKKENGQSFSLEDAQRVLKAALHIPDGRTVILQPGEGQKLPNQELVTGPSVEVLPDEPEVTEPVVTEPSVDIKPEDTTKPDDIPEVSKPAVELPPLVTGPAVEPATGEATELADIYIKVFEQYRSYGIGDYVAIRQLECLNDMDRYVIEKHLEDKYGKDVMWVDSVDTLIANGLGYDNGSYWWGIDGVIYYADEITITQHNTRIQVSGSAGMGGLAAQGYYTLLEKQDGQWVIIEHRNTWVS